jgi:hypothetical protein
VPDIGIESRVDGSLKTRVAGPTVIRGRRHGREVEVRLQASQYVTNISGSLPAGEANGDGRSGRLGALAGAPPALERAVADLPSDQRWRSVELTTGPDGVSVTRKARSSDAGESRWLYDLWLAERIAGALQSTSAGS